jgi:diguanylate cyclase (GGDEF)-like protein
MATERISEAPKESRRAREAGAATPLPAAKLLGIPQAEFTPKVRKAILRLTVEADGLQRELLEMRARLEATERAADQDQLLPILNRRAFVRELGRHIAFTARYGTPASLLYFDLDGFKLINDTFGHAAGDAVLAHFAGVLEAHVRDSDVVGRLGGDEFGIILAYTGEAQAHRKADALTETLNKSSAMWNGQPLAVGFSYGAFELKAAESADAALARADEAMYRQKRGR